MLRQVVEKMGFGWQLRRDKTLLLKSSYLFCMYMLPFSSLHMTKVFLYPVGKCLRWGLVKTGEASAQAHVFFWVLLTKTLPGKASPQIKWQDGNKLMDLRGTARVTEKTWDRALLGNHTFFFQECNLYVLRSHYMLKAGLLVPQRKDSMSHTVHTNKPKAILVCRDQ